MRQGGGGDRRHGLSLVSVWLFFGSGFFCLIHSVFGSVEKNSKDLFYVAVMMSWIFFVC